MPRVFLEAVRNSYGLTTKKSRRDSEIGFNQCGYDIALFNKEDSPIWLYTNDIFHASMSLSQAIWKDKGFKNTDLSYYPDGLKDLTDRDIEIVTVKEAKNIINNGRTLFIKPHWSHRKAFTAQLVNNTNGEIFKQKEDTKIVICSPNSFVSEWRLFIFKHEIIGCQYYKGSFRFYPRLSELDWVLKITKNLPIAYCADFGLNSLTDEWQLIECNEIMFANSFGLLPQKFAAMIAARWKEISC